MCIRDSDRADREIEAAGDKHEHLPCRQDHQRRGPLQEGQEVVGLEEDRVADADPDQQRQGDEINRVDGPHPAPRPRPQGCLLYTSVSQPHMA